MKELITKHSYRIRLDKSSPVLGQVAIMDRSNQFVFVVTPGRRIFTVTELRIITHELDNIKEARDIKNGR